MKKYIFLLFLLCSYITAFAQQKSTFSVSGVVYDDLDMPVPGANVYVKILREWELSQTLMVSSL